jgi:hypothetical protein
MLIRTASAYGNMRRRTAVTSSCEIILPSEKASYYIHCIYYAVFIIQGSLQTSENENENKNVNILKWKHLKSMTSKNDNIHNNGTHPKTIHIIP